MEEMGESPDGEDEMDDNEEDGVDDDQDQNIIHIQEHDQ